MNKVTPIGLCGIAGSGKDTVAKAIVDVFGEEMACVMSFADALKQEVSDGFLLHIDLLKGDTPESRLWRENATVLTPAWGKVSPRELLQKWGVMRRDSNVNYWVERMAMKVSGTEVPRFVVIPDVRFVNEAEWICRSGGAVWNVVGMDDVRESFADNVAREWDDTGDVDASVDLHVSEWEHRTSAFQEYVSGVVSNEGAVSDIDVSAIEEFALGVMGG